MKFLIKTFGCQMNVYDSKRLENALIAQGWSATEKPEDADLIVLNTCAVRKKASDKIFSQLGRYNLIKKPDCKIAVVGCVAKENDEKIFKRAPYVNYVFGPGNWHILLTAINNENKKIETIDKGVEKFDYLPQNSESSASAFVSIMEGCNNFCTYCIVPYTRGREVSRPFAEIMEEVNCLVANGAIEINFLGQNVNGYIDGKKTLTDLIKETAKLEKVKRILFTTSYPSYLKDDLINLYEKEPKLSSLIYLPLQAGSNFILQKMNRRYTREEYFAIVEKLKKARPEIQISSDFIVGFPGETDKDFEDTLDAVKRVKFINCFSFKYSPRPHTPAALLTNQVDEKVKQARLDKLQDELKKIQKEFNTSCIGKTLKVLVFDHDNKTQKYLFAKSDYNQTVLFEGDDSLIGKIAEVKIKSAGAATLKGELV